MDNNNLIREQFENTFELLSDGTITINDFLTAQLNYYKFIMRVDKQNDPIELQKEIHELEEKLKNLLEKEVEELVEQN